MKKEQQMVESFHERFSHPIAKSPTLEVARLQLRARLILEEAVEFCEAAGVPAKATLFERNGSVHRSFDSFGHAPPDLVGIADALGDLTYVTLGSAVELGIDLEPVVHEINRSNMSKSTEKAPDGKTIKGDAYSPPDLGAVLARQMAPAVDDRPPSDDVDAADGGGAH